MRKTAKYKMKLAWILIAALCVGMTPVLGMDSVKTVKAEETVQSDRQVTLDKGILKIEGIAIVTSETVADIDLQEVQKIEFGTGVKRISAGVFQNCKNLTEKQKKFNYDKNILTIDFTINQNCDIILNNQFKN